MGHRTSHRYWYFANAPDIGVRWRQGWCFGADALDAALAAVRAIGSEYLLPSDVHVTHDTACSCLPPEVRTY